MLSRFLGQSKATPEERLAEIIEKRMSGPVERAGWDHACPVCGTPWTKVTWYQRPDSDPEVAWSRCGACYVITADTLVVRDGLPTSLLTFIVAEREYAEFLDLSMQQWPAWSADVVSEVFREFAPFAARVQPRPIRLARVVC